MLPVDVNPDVILLVATFARIVRIRFIGRHFIRWRLVVSQLLGRYGEEDPFEQFSYVRCRNCSSARIQGGVWSARGLCRLREQRRRWNRDQRQDDCPKPTAHAYNPLTTEVRLS